MGKLRLHGLGIQLIEQRLCILQIGRVEALGEPNVDSDRQTAVPLCSDLRELGDRIRPYGIRRNHLGRHRVRRVRREQQTGANKKGRQGAEWVAENGCELLRATFEFTAPERGSYHLRKEGSPAIL